MPATISTINVLDSGGATRSIRAVDVSGTGAGPWVFNHTLADDTGVVVSRDNPVAVGGGRPVVSTASISSGQSLSAAVDLDRAALASIILPAAFTGTSLTFQVSPDNSTFSNLYDGNIERTYTVAQGRALAVPPGDWAAFRYIKIRSGTSGTPTNEAAGRTLTLIGVM